MKSHSNPENQTQETSFFQQKPNLLWGTLIFLFLAAMLIRINNLDASGILSEREYRSAIIARAFTLEASDSAPVWRKSVATISRERAGVLEPPITELLVSYLYRLVGIEHLRIARILSSIFWIVGGIFLYKMAEKIASTDAAVFTVAYYLFVPLGVKTSLTFLPDLLMNMMFLAGLFAMVLYFEQPSISRLVIAAIICGIAILVKPFVLFAVVGAFISLTIYKSATWKHIISSELIIFLGICLSMGALFYLYGIFVARSLTSNFQTAFFPSLFFERSYWKEWLLTATGVVGYTPLIAALISLPMLSQGLPRALLVGLWIGYVIFGLAYTYPISDSGHYHLQLIIIVALSLGPIIALLINHLRQLPNKWYWWIPVIGALVLVVYFNIRDLRQNLGPSRIIESKGVAQEIGEMVNHSSQTVYVAPYYGMPLEYYGELSGTYWPRRITNVDWVQDRLDGRLDLPGTYWFQWAINWVFRQVGEQELSIEERLAALDFSPEYFVITNFDEFNRHHTDLKEFLINNCSLIAENERYLIYEACTKQSDRSN